jgi:hypothetical protein
MFKNAVGMDDAIEEKLRQKRINGDLEQMRNGSESGFTAKLVEYELLVICYILEPTAFCCRTSHLRGANLTGYVQIFSTCNMIPQSASYTVNKWILKALRFA